MRPTAGQRQSRSIRADCDPIDIAYCLAAWVQRDSFARSVFIQGSAAQAIAYDPSQVDIVFRGWPATFGNVGHIGPLTIGRNRDLAYVMSTQFDRIFRFKRTRPPSYRRVSARRATVPGLLPGASLLYLS